MLGYSIVNFRGCYLWTCESLFFRPAILRMSYVEEIHFVMAIFDDADQI